MRIVIALSCCFNCHNFTNTLAWTFHLRSNSNNSTKSIHPSIFSPQLRFKVVNKFVNLKTVSFSNQCRIRSIRCHHSKKGDIRQVATSPTPPPTYRSLSLSLFLLSWSVWNCYTFIDCLLSTKNKTPAFITARTRRQSSLIFSLFVYCHFFHKKKIESRTEWST